MWSSLLIYALICCYLISFDLSYYICYCLAYSVHFFVLMSLAGNAAFHAACTCNPASRPSTQEHTELCYFWVRSKLIRSFIESLVNLFWYCIVVYGKTGSVPTYSSLLSFRGFVDICIWFSCVLRSCGLNGQVLYITFGPTYVVLYRFILGELVTIVIVICIVRKGCRLVLSGLQGIGCLSVLMGFEV